MHSNYTCGEKFAFFKVSFLYEGYVDTQYISELGEFKTALIEYELFFFPEITFIDASIA